MPKTQARVHSEDTCKKDWRKKVTVRVFTGLISWFILYALIESHAFKNVVTPLFVSPNDRGATAVVLIDDTTLDRQRLSWPVPYNYYASLIRRLACAEPQSIFVDIYLSRNDQFNGKNAPGNELLDLLDKLRNRPEEVRCGGEPLDKAVPVYFPDHPALAEPFRTNTPKDYLVDIRVVKDPYAEPQVYKATNNGRTPTAAFTLIEQSCSQAAAPGWCPSHVPTFYDGDLSLQWNPFSYVWDQNDAGVKRNGHDLSRNCRIIHRIRDAVLQSMPWKRADLIDEPVCRSVPTFNALELSGATDAEHARQDAILANRIVMVGGSFSGSRDNIVTPYMPNEVGIFAHATAVDILARDGKSYRKPSSMTAGPTVAIFAYFVFIVFEALYEWMQKWMKPIVIPRFLAVLARCWVVVIPCLTIAGLSIIPSQLMTGVLLLSALAYSVFCFFVGMHTHKHGSRLYVVYAPLFYLSFLALYLLARYPAGDILQTFFVFALALHMSDIATFIWSCFVFVVSPLVGCSERKNNGSLETEQKDVADD